MQLAKSLSTTQWHDVMRLARDKGLCATCLDGIECARACFHTRPPDFVLAGLAESNAKERPATYLNASKLRQQWMDFRALKGLSSQLRFLQELVLPPAAYMRAKYPEAQPGRLLWLYVRRAHGGPAKSLKTNQQTP